MAPFELNLTPKTEPVTLDLNLAQPTLIHNIHNLPTELVSASQILNVTIPPQYRVPPSLIQGSTHSSTQAELSSAVAVATQGSSNFTITTQTADSCNTLPDVSLDMPQ